MGAHEEDLKVVVAGIAVAEILQEILSAPIHYLGDCTLNPAGRKDRLCWEGEDTVGAEDKTDDDPNPVEAGAGRDFRRKAEGATMTWLRLDVRIPV